MERSRVRRRLVQVSKRLVAAREDLSVVDEQLRQLRETEEDARVRCLVSETPLADRELVEARRHTAAMSASRDAICAELARLERTQADLLGEQPFDFPD